MWAEQESCATPNKEEQPAPLSLRPVKLRRKTVHPHPVHTHLLLASNKRFCKGTEATSDARTHARLRKTHTHTQHTHTHTHANVNNTFTMQMHSDSHFCHCFQAQHLVQVFKSVTEFRGRHTCPADFTQTCHSYYSVMGFQCCVLGI